MLIDWFTVGAQALNFLILVWLMKHFLYKPILLAIDTREKRIADELKDASAKQAEALKQSKIYQDKNKAIDNQRAALLKKATDDAAAEGQRLLDLAKKTADALSAKRRDAESADEKRLAKSIAQRTGDEVFAIARKALTDLASANLEEQIIALFLKKLRELNGKAKQTLGEALTRASDHALLRTSFDLPETQRLMIEKALHDIFAATIHVNYQTAPDLICGIDLSAQGQKISWSIADFVSGLEKSIDADSPKKPKAAAKNKQVKAA